MRVRGTIVSAVTIVALFAATTAFAAGLAPTIGPRVPHGAGGPAGASAPAVLFRLHCSGCHGVDGAGSEGAVPDLRGNLGRLVSAPEGRRFVLGVPGVAQARLGDEDLAQLANWMVQAFSAETLPRGFRPIDAEEVREARRAVPADVSAARRRVVATLRERGVDVR